MAFQVSTEWDTSRIPISRVALNLIRSFFRCDAKNPLVYRSSIDIVHRSTILLRFRWITFLDKFENSTSILEQRYLTRPPMSILTWYKKKRNSSYPRIHPICKSFRIKRSTNVSILIRDQLPAIDSSFHEWSIYITSNVYQDRYSVSLNFRWYNTRFHSLGEILFSVWIYTRFNGKDLTTS